MNMRRLDYLSAAMIAISVLFLVFFVLSTKTTLITQEGSSLNQGYIGDANINNVAVGALVALGISVLINRKYAKQSKKTKLIRDAGTLVLFLAGLWFLIVLLVVIYLFSSGRFLEGWQF